MKRGRPDPKAQRRTFRATERFLALASPKPMGEIFPPELERKARATPNKRPEGDAQDEVIDWLLANPRVHGLKRLNKGLAVEGNRRVPYCRVFGKHEGKYMTVLDLEFWHVFDDKCNDPVITPCEIEMKAPGFTRPNMKDKTQRAQFYRIEYVRAHGGIAAFCTSVADVERLLNGTGS